MSFRLYLKQLAAITFFLPSNMKSSFYPSKVEWVVLYIISCLSTRLAAFEETAHSLGVHADILT